MTQAALPNSVAMQLSYKAYATGVITPGSEPTPASDPGVSGAQQLRRISSTMSPLKGSFKAEEIRPDRQVSDLRHGARRVAGDITGNLSPKTYQDFMAAVLRGAWVAGASKTQTDFTSIAATASTSKLTVGSSTWAAQLFKVGDIIRLTGVAAPNLGVNFTITSLAGTDAFVNPAPADLSPDTTFGVSVVGRKLFSPATSLIIPKFAIEHFHSDTLLTHLFTECRAYQMKLTVGATGNPTIAFSFLGRNIKDYGSGSSPFFTSPTAPTDTTLIGTFGGQLLVGGVVQAVVTGIDLTATIGASITDAAFQDLPPEIYTGSEEVGGTVQLLLADNVLLDAFMNETELEMILTLTTADSTTADFVSFYMARVKLTGLNIQNSGQQGVPITVPFTALKKAVTTGYDATTLVIQDSLSA